MIMMRSVKEQEEYSIVIYPDGAVVIDNYGNVVVKCPTEDEAVEYIRDLQSEVD